MFNKSWRQIQDENFKALDAKLDAIIGNTKSLVSLDDFNKNYNCKVGGAKTPWSSHKETWYPHESPKTPWYKFKWDKILFSDEYRTLIKSRIIKDPISTKNGFALILNHILSLFVLGTIIAYFAR